MTEERQPAVERRHRRPGPQPVARVEHDLDVAAGRSRWMGPVAREPMRRSPARPILAAPGSPLDVAGAIGFGGWIYPTISNAFEVVISKDNGTTAATQQYSLFTGLVGPAASSASLRRAGFQALVAVSPGYVVNAWNLVIATYDGATITLHQRSRRAPRPWPCAAVGRGLGRVRKGRHPGRQQLRAERLHRRLLRLESPLPAADVARLYRQPPVPRPAVDIGWLTSGSASARRPPLAPHPLRPGGLPGRIA